MVLSGRSALGGKVEFPRPHGTSKGDRLAPGKAEHSGIPHALGNVTHRAMATDVSGQAVPDYRQAPYKRLTY
jgi:hypothetical protein